MPNYSVFDKTGKKVSDIALSDAIFAITPNASAMHLCVVAYLANQRQGTQSTLTRAEVRGGGKKPWRQKGSGRARQGSIRSPQYPFGGIALGPKPREYGKTVNKKVRRLAMKSALSSKVAAEELIVLDSLEMNEIKTKEVVSVLKALETGKKGSHRPSREERDRLQKRSQHQGRQDHSCQHTQCLRYPQLRFSRSAQGCRIED